MLKTTANEALSSSLLKPDFRSDDVDDDDDEDCFGTCDCNGNDDDDDNNGDDEDDEAVEVLPHSHQLLCVTKAMSGASLSSHTTAL